MTRSPSPAASSSLSEAESDKSFSDTEAFVHRPERRIDKDRQDSEEEDGWELDYIEESRLTDNEENDTVQRFYKLKFKGYDDPEWQPENNVDALELVRCFWENIRSGSQGCIQEQQKLLIEIENRPDSDEEDANLPPPSNPNGFNHRKNKKFKRHKQLKPRKEAANSDVAESDSDSSVSGDEDSDLEESLQYYLPPSLSDFGNDSNLPCSNPHERTYKLRSSKMQNQMKNQMRDTKTVGDLDTASSLSALMEGIDLDYHKYKAKNSENAKLVEPLIEEIELLTLRIKRHRRLRIILRGEDQSHPNELPNIGGCEEPTRRSKEMEQSPEAKRREIKQGKQPMRDEVTLNDDTHSAITQVSDENCTVSKSPNSVQDARQVSETPRNLYSKMNIPAASSSRIILTPRNFSPNAFPRSSPQAAPTISTHQPSEEEEEEEEDPHPVTNPRVKRKITTEETTKYPTLNEMRKKFWPKRSRPFLCDDESCS